MLFKNVRTGNTITVTNKAVIELYKKSSNYTEVSGKGAGSSDKGASNKKTTK